MVVSVLLLTSTLASTILTLIRASTTELFGEVPGTQVVWQFGNLGLSLATIFVLFLLMYRFLPRAEVGFRDVWLGALLAAVAWVALKEIFALFVGSSFAAGTTPGRRPGVLTMSLPILKREILAIGWSSRACRRSVD